MFSSYFFYLKNNYGLLHFVRGFIHLTVLASLIIYQFLFSLFVNPHLSISLYTLCSIILLFDGLYLFFYKDNEIFNKYFNLVLCFLDACFFMVLMTILGFAGLSFVLSLIFLEIVTLSICFGWFSGVSFSFLMSVLLLTSFVWQGNLSYETRKSLVTLVISSLSVSLIFGYFLHYIWGKLKRRLFQMEESISSYKDQFGQHVPSYHLENSLNLSRKIKPALNFLVKNFLEIKNRESLPKYYENHLKQLQKFIGNYIKYLESEEYIFKSIHLPQLLENLLKRLGNHKNRPTSLKENLEYNSSTEWIECSAEHLEIAIENIIENSFQALKNEVSPEVEIKVYDEDNKIILEFRDNGHGIEENDQKNLFDPLFSKRLGIGGVGLAYVLKVIKAHKGEIDIVSSSQGTRVIIKLPVLLTSGSKLSLTA